MKAELQAFEDAKAEMNFVKATELADSYVTTHLGEFADLIDKVTSSANEAEARDKIVQTVESLRDVAKMPELAAHAEAFLFHRWHPIDVGGTFQPTVRNDSGVAPTATPVPVVRNDITAAK